MEGPLQCLPLSCHQRIHKGQSTEFGATAGHFPISNEEHEKPLISTHRPQGLVSKASNSAINTDAKIIAWGRWAGESWLVTAGCAGITILCPLLVIFLWIALENFDGSLFASLSALWSTDLTSFVARFAPQSSVRACIGYGSWLVFQAALYTLLPTKIGSGQLTPAGNLLQYKTNGLLAWALTHLLAVMAAITGVLDPAVLAKHWEGLLVAANLFGFILSGFAYLKAYIAPTHPTDRKFSGMSLLKCFWYSSVLTGYRLCVV